MTKIVGTVFLTVTDMEAYLSSEIHCLVSNG